MTFITLSLFSHFYFLSMPANYCLKINRRLLKNLASPEIYFLGKFLLRSEVKVKLFQ
jgi:hypothetical protein